LNEEPGVTVIRHGQRDEGLLALTWIAHPDLVVLEWGCPAGRGRLLAAAHALAGRPSSWCWAATGLSRTPCWPAPAPLCWSATRPSLLLAALRQVRAALRGDLSGEAAEGAVARNVPRRR